MMILEPRQCSAIVPLLSPVPGCSHVMSIEVMNAGGGGRVDGDGDGDGDGNGGDDDKHPRRQRWLAIFEQKRPLPSLHCNIFLNHTNAVTTLIQPSPLGRESISINNNVLLHAATYYRHHHHRRSSHASYSTHPGAKTCTGTKQE